MRKTVTESKKINLPEKQRVVLSSEHNYWAAQGALVLLAHDGSRFRCHLQQELAAPEINAAEALCRPCARSCQAKVLSWILAFLAGSCSYRRQVGHALKFRNKRSTVIFFDTEPLKKLGWFEPYRVPTTPSKLPWTSAFPLPPRFATRQWPFSRGSNLPHDWPPPRFTKLGIQYTWI